MDSGPSVLAITRPHPNLLWVYVLHSLLAGPLFPVVLIYHLFRYHTLQYRFDKDGVSMKWGRFWKAETYLTYSRIQDIHVSRGLIERWLGLGTVQVQTASGSSMAEMTIEGLVRYDAVRNFLYERMRGARGRTPGPGPKEAPAAGPEASAILAQIRDELRAIRLKLEERK